MNGFPMTHTFVKDEKGIWHIFGITHPLVETDPLSKGIHEGEYASFHALSSATHFKEALKEHHYSDLPKILRSKIGPGRSLPTTLLILTKKEWAVSHGLWGTVLFDWPCLQTCPNGNPKEIYSPTLMELAIRVCFCMREPIIWSMFG